MLCHNTVTKYNNKKDSIINISEEKIEENLL